MTVDISGLRNETKIKELLVKGSEAITTKNDFGIHIFSGSAMDDGIISAKLQKPKYDNSEIQKTVDVRIIELIPPPAPDVPDTVLRSVYNPVTQSVIDLTFQVQTLNGIVNNLTAKIKEIEIVSQSLRIDIDSKELIVATAQNQTTQTNQKISTTVVELQNAIQKATNEALQRVSLFARNEALLSENSNLKDQLFGKAAKIAEGAKVAQEFSVKTVAKSNTNLGDLAFTSRWNGNGNVTWINGPDIELYNFTKDAVTLTFSPSGEAGDVFATPGSVTLQPSETRIIKVSVRPASVANKLPRQLNQGDVSYTAALTVKSKTSSVTLSSNFNKIGAV
jgi:hypothetical protein